MGSGRYSCRFTEGVDASPRTQLQCDFQEGIGSEQISKIVLGWPLNMDGGETDKTREVASFKLKVESETGLPVELSDERLSSQMAEHISGGKKD